MENGLFSSQHFVNLIFLAGAPTVTLIPHSSQFLKFSTSFFFKENTTRKTEIMYRRIWEKVRENFLLSEHTIDRMFFFTSVNLYGAAFKMVGNQHYTEIMKQRGQSLRCLRLLHLLNKIMLFERTKHWTNIYASMGLNNNSDNF
ncbi:hypothetical protein HZS_8006 [Henneguya salminicola]|nr:hypothetical protein HZS_8006 [Henneguya salminicola]